ncbi:MAG TPA: hypothetical protein GX526_01485, partial [Thermoanaerobacterales bacterium]|nr:hypothetical protein [Thermoanaerobacterales bacterium]
LFKISNNISKFEFAFTKEEIDDVLDFSHFIEFWDKLPGYTILFLGSNNILISSPEFDLFESACWFHNEALKSNDMNVDGWEEDLFGQKQSIHHKNMCRQTIINSFLFLEAFINSLAYDFAEKNKNISKEDKLFLTEKTINKQGKKVQRFVSIEDKLHKWVKIMSPRSETFDKGRLPFQDFKEIKKVRDTIIHLTNKKVEYFRSINLEFAQKALDVSVEMVKEIARFISHDKVEYPFWLKDKDEDGFYNVSRYYKIDDDVFEKLKEPIIN